MNADPRPGDHKQRTSDAVGLWFVLAIVLSAAFFFTSYVVTTITGIDGSLLVRDANAIADQPPYYALLEHGTSSILLMSGAILVFEVLRHRLAAANAADYSTLCFGLLTIVLGVDDLLMVHESVTYFGIPEAAVMALWAALLGIAVLLDPTGFLRGRVVIFLIAVIALGLGGLEDVTDLRPIGIGLEEYWEILGFSFWSIYALACAVSR